MTTIKTTWGKIFEKDGLVLFNEFPNILRDLGRYDEAYQWFPPEDERDEV